jgi:hypothetical protein
MAKSKNTNLHKQIENEEDDPFAAAARVSEETSSDGKFSTYELAPKKDPRDGDLILQYRGAPSE